MNIKFFPSRWQGSIFAYLLSGLLLQQMGAQPQMPEAISISPSDASAGDTITLTLDIRRVCMSEKSLPFTGQEILYMSGIPIYPWEERAFHQGGVRHPEPGFDGTPSTMTYNGDSTYSIRFQPAGYFAASGEIKGMMLEFADFDQQRQAFDHSPFGCIDFYVPLKTSPPFVNVITPGVSVEIGGLFSEDTELDYDTIRIVDYVNIDIGVTMMIRAGAYVELEDTFRINVFGNLLAEGNESDSIIFTAKDPASGWKGIWFGSQSDFNPSLLSFCRFSHVRTYNDWNGVINANYYPALSISHCVVSENNAHAINLVNSDILIDHTTFSYNSKGGISSYASNFNLINSRVINNGNHGMYLNLSDPVIVNSIISNNDPDGMVLTAADPGIFNSIIAKNAGIAIWMEISNPRIVNSILWENGAYLELTDPASTVRFKKCMLPVIPPEWQSTGQFPGFEDNYFDVDPMFLNPPVDQGISPQAETADWSLPLNSVGVNNGTTDIEGFEIPPTDLLGHKRIAYGLIDIGPIEFFQPGTSLTIDSDVTSDTIWLADTVKITTDILVHNGVKLTIAPGTMVEFQGHYGMRIEGCLDASGAAGYEIRFTVSDTAGFYQSDTTLGTWGGLSFATGENPPSVLKYCIFEYAAKMTGIERMGGAVLITDHSSPNSITHCLFQHNRSTDLGGALAILWSGPFISENEFLDNSSNEGGAVYTSPTSSALLVQNYIHHNSAQSYGGGIYISGPVVLSNNRIGYNEAGDQGGGVYCRKSKARIIGNLIYNNRFGGLAGKNCDPFIANNLIVNNAADAGLGARTTKREGSGIFIDINSDAIILNNTIANNLSSQYKGSSVWLYSRSRFINNIVWGNRDDFGNPAPLAIEGAIDVDVTNCIIEGGENSIRAESPEYHGNIEQIIDSLPQFLDPAKGAGTGFEGDLGSWNINALSPAINNGTYDQELFQDLQGDYAMNPRNPDAFDIGAYEHQTGELELFSQPIDIVGCDGDTAIFKVEANDTAYYQWYRNEQILEGAVLPVLRMENVDQEQQGIYYCHVWNAYGHRTSEPSLLIVNHPPEIFIQPEHTWMVEGNPTVLEFQAEGSPPMHYQWFKDGMPIPEAMQPKLFFPYSGSETEGRYYCTIGNICGEVSTDSIQLFLAPQICMVTVDTITGDNLIIWEKRTNAPIASYNVYRESVVKGQYEILASVPVDSLSIFVDTTANPVEQAYIYKITAVDEFGNESDIEYCRPHKTIHLLTSFNTESNTAQLDWDEYYGFPYGTYYIYRSSSKEGFYKVKDISSSFKTWLDTYAEPNTRYYYRVAVERAEPCQPSAAGKKAGTGPYRHALSNLDDNKLKATGLIPVRVGGKVGIFPNPMNERARIVFPNDRSELYTFSLRDLSGKLVRSADGITGEEFILERAGLSPGFYEVELSGPVVFRAKLIIR